eukprot:1840988-Pleurochrysis_carterae.AAC.1
MSASRSSTASLMSGRVSAPASSSTAATTCGVRGCHEAWRSRWHRLSIRKSPLSSRSSLADCGIFRGAVCGRFKSRSAWQALAFAWRTLPSTKVVGASQLLPSAQAS